MKLPSRAASLAAIYLFSLSAAAQTAPLSSHEVPFVQDTGWVANDGRSGPAVVASFAVRVAGADWLQLAFEDVVLAGNASLGTGALLRVTSHRDGAVQELNSEHVRQWQRQSAYFNGDTVQVEVVAWPGTGRSRLRLATVTAGDPPLESQCGISDDRVASADPRQGRLLPVGCTGWLIDDCAHCTLTAGHCSGTSLSTLQFNVPLSNAGGGLNHPGPQDQYAVDVSSKQRTDGGVGNDWGYFGVHPNSNTGLTPFEAQGAAYSVEPPPSFNASHSIRITGYGTDTGMANQTQQTEVGPWVSRSGTTLRYRTDTEGGNSGSPVVHEESGLAIGIHTHGGCDAAKFGSNAGTGANHSGLQGALAAPRGVCDEPCDTVTSYCDCSSGAPCGNESTGGGCLNSSGQGASASASGSTSASADDLVITVSDVPVDKFGLIYMGPTQIQTAFGDGQRCVGAGGLGTFRYGVHNSGAAGQLVLGPGIVALAAQKFPAAGQIGAGQTWNFQAWFRDPMGGPCGSGFNTSNALAVPFLP